MKVIADKHFEKKLIKVYKKDRKLFELINKKLAIIQNNLQHPSLRLHKLTGKHEEVWSIYITKSYRVLFRFEEGNIYLIELGEHGEVY